LLSNSTGSHLPLSLCMIYQQLIIPDIILPKSHDERLNIVYGWIVFFTEWSVLLLQTTGFIAVAGIFGILGWIGYTLATTLPP